MHLERATWKELPSVAELAALAVQKPELFLLVSESANKEDQKALIDSLSAALPHHRVFDAGVREGRARVTVLQVLPHSVILEHLERFHKAAWAYRQLANKLMPRLYEKLGLLRDAEHWGTHPQTGQLDENWAYFFHGAHCALGNPKTGESVEASLWFGGEFGVLDAGFLGRFIQKTPGFEDIAPFVIHEYHDGCRILEVLEQDGRLARIQVKNHEGLIALPVAERL
ncbi:hypothetical protein [Armatimonas sp.]|uniref:DUF6896 domain-containing protein n=1 Tax=Armatimonas sp. TaxID=1872638 RepID=UPI00286BF795|nr:hypothetical protein [Armatimonas sp.]